MLRSIRLLERALRERRKCGSDGKAAWKRQEETQTDFFALAFASCCESASQTLARIVGRARGRCAYLEWPRKLHRGSVREEQEGVAAEEVDERCKEFLCTSSCRRISFLLSPSPLVLSSHFVELRSTREAQRAARRSTCRLPVTIQLRPLQRFLLRLPQPHRARPRHIDCVI